MTKRYKLEMYLKQTLTKFNTSQVPAKQRGLGLPMAIFIITVMAFIAVAINELSEGGAKAVGANVLSMRAFYAAESGANIVLAINGSGAPCGAATTVTIAQGQMRNGLANCTARITCTPQGSGPIYVLNSRGQCGTGIDMATREIEVVLE